MYTVTFDERTGLVECLSSGFLRVEDLAQHTIVTRAAVDRCRARFGYIRMLVEGFGSVPQSSDVAAKIERTRWIENDRDRMAVVIDSALCRMQGQRVLAGDQVRIFDNREAALAWVMAPPEICAT